MLRCNILNNRKIPSEPKSIVLISRKYDLDPKLLTNAFIEAFENKVHQYGSLKVTCRNVNQDSATFLITNEEKVVSQFPIKLDILRKPNTLIRLVQTFPVSYHAKKEIRDKQKKINELHFRMKGISVKAKIIKIPPKQTVFTSFGTEAYVSNVSIADETGTIILSLWNSQIDKIHIGDEVEIGNCYVARYAGELQLRMRRNSALSVINKSEVKPNPLPLNS